MTDLSEGNKEFCRLSRRPDVPRESICLSCFRTVKAANGELLDDAEDAHRRECPNHMKLPPTFAVQ